MSGRCQNCRHWGVATDRHAMRKCQAIGDDGVPDLVVPAGDYGYGAKLDTGPNFGCVLFATPLPDAETIAAIVKVLTPSVFDLSGHNGDTLTITDATSVIARFNGGEPVVLEREPGWLSFQIEASKHGQGLLHVEVWPTKVGLS